MCMCVETKIKVLETIVEANIRYSAAPRFYNVNLLYLRGIKRKKHLFYDIHRNSTDNKKKTLNVINNGLVHALVLFSIKIFKLYFSYVFNQII